MMRARGRFERFTLNEPSTVKIITVKSGEAFSFAKARTPRRVLAGHFRQRHRDARR